MLGLFIGYHTFAGGGWGSDDLELIDLQELQEAESRQDVYVKRFKWQEIIVEKDGHGKFKYPAQVKGFSQPAGKKNQYPLQASDEDNEELDILDDGLEGSVAGLAPRDLPTGEHEEDYWSFSPGCDTILYRWHRRPRTSLYVPEDGVDDLPIPRQFLDILRFTKTDSDYVGEDRVKDYWTTQAFPDPAQPSKSHDLSEPWTGHTRFYVRRPPPPKNSQGLNQAWVYGHEEPVRAQKTARSPHWHPVSWFELSKSRRDQLGAKWAKEKPRRAAERLRVDFPEHITGEDTEVGKAIRELYHEELAKAIKRTRDINTEKVRPEVPTSMVAIESSYLRLSKTRGFHGF